MKKKKQEKEERLAILTPWLQEQIKDTSGFAEPPEEILPALNQLHVNLFHRKNTEASQLLATMLDKQTVRRVVFDILLKFGLIDKDADRFLVLAGIDEQFSQRVLDNVKEISAFEGDDQREQLGDLYSFSIDDEETSDIDDALSVEFLEDRTRVGIHIADVSHYIKRGDLLDKEASQRVTSIYLPSRTVNMFPKELSQGLASLLEGELRPSMTCWADFDAEGTMIDWRVSETAITVTRRLSYNYVDALLAGEEEDEELLEKVEYLNELAIKLQEKRLENGAAVFNKPELKIRVKEGEVTVKEGRKDSASRFLVSEFMVLGNSVTALYAARNDVPMIYRTQDKPEGLPELDPLHYDPVLFDKAIRCMKRSRLSLHPSSHGGLGVDFYTQVTSPIRRFTDLVLQRQVSAHLRGEKIPYEADELMKVLANADSIGNEVKDVQRSSESYWLHEYIRRNTLSEEIEATVVSNAQGGYFVELDETYNRIKMASQEKLMASDRVLLSIDKVNSEKGFINVTFKELLDRPEQDEEGTEDDQ